MTHANQNAAGQQDGLEHSGSTTPVQSVHANRLIIMTRYPEAGKTKTRLIPALGAESAAYLHSQLIKHTWNKVCEQTNSPNYDIDIRYFGGTTDKMQQLLDGNANCKPQQGDSLGEKMHTSVVSAFEAGVSKTILIGTDCPEINSEIINNAFKKLNTSDVVIGPATDGGYYLLGQSKPVEKVFEGIEWGTDVVLHQTLVRCNDASLSVEQLAPRSDVDYPEDLINCRKHGLAFEPNETRNRPECISIIIPTLNEEKVLFDTLASISTCDNVEIIIADGGSQDRTIEIAKEFDVRIVQSQSGRGRQMNAGAAVANGETLLFMHADSSLPDSFQRDIQNILKDNIAGAFRLKIDGLIFGKSIVEWGANVRSKYRQKPYGDQGFFIKANDFYQLDSFKNWPIMEDYEFIRRVKKAGRIGIASTAMRTSGRRWQKRGLIRNTLRNQLCVIAYRLGFSPDQIAKFYARES